VVDHELLVDQVLRWPRDWPLGQPAAGTQRSADTSGIALGVRGPLPAVTARYRDPYTGAEQTANLPVALVGLTIDPPIGGDQTGGLPLTVSASDIQRLDHLTDAQRQVIPGAQLLASPPLWFRENVPARYGWHYTVTFQVDCRVPTSDGGTITLTDGACANGGQFTETFVQWIDVYAPAEK
jgi:hypothetical protein